MTDCTHEKTHCETTILNLLFKLAKEANATRKKSEHIGRYVERCTAAELHLDEEILVRKVESGNVLNLENVQDECDLLTSSFPPRDIMGVGETETESPSNGPSDSTEALVCSLHSPEVTKILEVFGGSDSCPHSPSSDAHFDEPKRSDSSTVDGHAEDMADDSDDDGIPSLSNIDDNWILSDFLFDKRINHKDARREQVTYVDKARGEVSKPKIRDERYPDKYDQKEMHKGNHTSSAPGEPHTVKDKNNIPIDRSQLREDSYLRETSKHDVAIDSLKDHKRQSSERMEIQSHKKRTQRKHRPFKDCYQNLIQTEIESLELRTHSAHNLNQPIIAKSTIPSLKSETDVQAKKSISDSNCHKKVYFGEQENLNKRIKRETRCYARHRCLWSFLEGKRWYAMNAIDIPEYTCFTSSCGDACEGMFELQNKILKHIVVYMDILQNMTQFIYSNVNDKDSSPRGISCKPKLNASARYFLKNNILSYKQVLEDITTNKTCSNQAQNKLPGGKEIYRRIHSPCRMGDKYVTRPNYLRRDRHIKPQNNNKQRIHTRPRRHGRKTMFGARSNISAESLFRSTETCEQSTSSELKCLTTQNVRHKEILENSYFETKSYASENGRRKHSTSIDKHLGDDTHTLRTTSPATQGKYNGRSQSLESQRSDESGIMSSSSRSSIQSPPTPESSSAAYKKVLVSFAKGQDIHVHYRQSKLLKLSSHTGKNLVSDPGCYKMPHKLDIAYSPKKSLYVDLPRCILANCLGDDPRLSLARQLRVENIRPCEKSPPRKDPKYRTYGKKVNWSKLVAKSDSRHFHNKDKSRSETKYKRRGSKLGDGGQFEMSPRFHQDGSTVTQNEFNASIDNNHSATGDGADIATPFRVTHASPVRGSPRSRDTKDFSHLTKQQTLDMLDELCTSVRHISPLPDNSGDNDEKTLREFDISFVSQEENKGHLSRPESPIVGDLSLSSSDEDLLEETIESEDDDAKDELRFCHSPEARGEYTNCTNNNSNSHQYMHRPRSARRTMYQDTVPGTCNSFEYDAVANKLSSCEESVPQLEIRTRYYSSKRRLEPVDDKGTTRPLDKKTRRTNTVMPIHTSKLHKNTNNNHTNDTKKSKLSPAQEDSSIDLDESANEHLTPDTNDYLCDYMCTPIVLSAADRVYHVSAAPLTGVSPQHYDTLDDILSFKPMVSECPISVTEATDSPQLSVDQSQPSLFNENPLLTLGLDEQPNAITQAGSIVFPFSPNVTNTMHLEEQGSGYACSYLESFSLADCDHGVAQTLEETNNNRQNIKFTKTGAQTGDFEHDFLDFLPNTDQSIELKPMPLCSNTLSASDDILNLIPNFLYPLEDNSQINNGENKANMHEDSNTVLLNLGTDLITSKPKYVHGDTLFDSTEHFFDVEDDTTTQVLANLFNEPEIIDVDNEPENTNEFAVSPDESSLSGDGNKTHELLDLEPAPSNWNQDEEQVEENDDDEEQVEKIVEDEEKGESPGVLTDPESVSAENDSLQTDSSNVQYTRMSNRRKLLLLCAQKQTLPYVSHSLPQRAMQQVLQLSSIASNIKRSLRLKSPKGLFTARTLVQKDAKNSHPTRKQSQSVVNETRNRNGGKCSRGVRRPKRRRRSTKNKSRVSQNDNQEEICNDNDLQHTSSTPSSLQVTSLVKENNVGEIKTSKKKRNKATRANAVCDHIQEEIVSAQMFMHTLNSISPRFLKCRHRRTRKPESNTVRLAKRFPRQLQDSKWKCNTKNDHRKKMDNTNIGDNLEKYNANNNNNNDNTIESRDVNVRNVNKTHDNTERPGKMREETEECYILHKQNGVNNPNLHTPLQVVRPVVKKQKRECIFDQNITPNTTLHVALELLPDNCFYTKAVLSKWLPYTNFSFLTKTFVLTIKECLNTLLYYSHRGVFNTLCSSQKHSIDFSTTETFLFWEFIIKMSMGLFVSKVCNRFRVYNDSIDTFNGYNFIDNFVDGNKNNNNEIEGALTEDEQQGDVEQPKQINTDDSLGDQTTFLHNTGESIRSTICDSFSLFSTRKISNDDKDTSIIQQDGGSNRNNPEHIRLNDNNNHYETDPVDEVKKGNTPHNGKRGGESPSLELADTNSNKEEKTNDMWRQSSTSISHDLPRIGKNMENFNAARRRLKEINSRLTRSYNKQQYQAPKTIMPLFSRHTDGARPHRGELSDERIPFKKPNDFYPFLRKRRERQNRTDQVKGDRHTLNDHESLAQQTNAFTSKCKNTAANSKTLEEEIPTGESHTKATNTCAKTPRLITSANSAGDSKSQSTAISMFVQRPKTAVHQKKSLLNRDKDNSRRLQEPEGGDVDPSLARFVERLNSSYGEQLAKGTAHNQANLEELCSKYLQAAGARRRIETTLKNYNHGDITLALKPENKTSRARNDELGNTRELSGLSLLADKTRLNGNRNKHLLGIETSGVVDNTRRKLHDCNDNMRKSEAVGPRRSGNASVKTYFSDNKFEKGNVKGQVRAKRGDTPTEGLSRDVSSSRGSKLRTSTDKGKHSVSSSKQPSRNRTSCPLRPDIQECVDRLNSRSSTPIMRLHYDINKWESNYGKYFGLTSRENDDTSSFPVPNQRKGLKAANSTGSVATVGRRRLSDSPTRTPRREPLATSRSVEDSSTVGNGDNVESLSEMGVRSESACTSTGSRQQKIDTFFGSLLNLIEQKELQKKQPSSAEEVKTKETVHETKAGSSQMGSSYRSMLENIKAKRSSVTAGLEENIEIPPLSYFKTMAESAEMTLNLPDFNLRQKRTKTQKSSDQAISGKEKPLSNDCLETRCTDISKVPETCSEDSKSGSVYSVSLPAGYGPEFLTETSTHYPATRLDKRDTRMNQDTAKTTRDVSHKGSFATLEHNSQGHSVHETAAPSDTSVYMGDRSGSHTTLTNDSPPWSEKAGLQIKKSAKGSYECEIIESPSTKHQDKWKDNFWKRYDMTEENQTKQKADRNKISDLPVSCEGGNDTLVTGQENGTHNPEDKVYVNHTNRLENAEEESMKMMSNPISPARSSLTSSTYKNVPYSPTHQFEIESLDQLKLQAEQDFDAIYKTIHTRNTGSIGPGAQSPLWSSHAGDPDPQGVNTVTHASIGGIAGGSVSPHNKQTQSKITTHSPIQETADIELRPQSDAHRNLDTYAPYTTHELSSSVDNILPHDYNTYQHNNPYSDLDRTRDQQYGFAGTEFNATADIPWSQMGGQNPQAYNFSQMAAMSSRDTREMMRRNFGYSYLSTIQEENEEDQA